MLLRLLATTVTLASPPYLLPVEAADVLACALPTALQSEVSARYPGMRVASLADLGADDRDLFLKEHGHDCPGIASLTFYGDGRPTLAIELLGSKSNRATLIVARQSRDKWTVTQLDTSDGPSPVVWDDPPGEYVDVESGNRVKSARPVLVWCQFDAWAIVYAWTGSTVEKAWIRD